MLRVSRPRSRKPASVRRTGYTTWGSSASSWDIPSSTCRFSKWLLRLPTTRQGRPHRVLESQQPTCVAVERMPQSKLQSPCLRRTCSASDDSVCNEHTRLCLIRHLEDSAVESQVRQPAGIPAGILFARMTALSWRASPTGHKSSKELLIKTVSRSRGCTQAAVAWPSCVLELLLEKPDPEAGSLAIACLPELLCDGLRLETGEVLRSRVSQTIQHRSGSRCWAAAAHRRIVLQESCSRVELGGLFVCGISYFAQHCRLPPRKSHGEASFEFKNGGTGNATWFRGLVI